MAKLHELLAVDGDQRSQAEATRTELKATFQKKTTHFTKKVVTYKSKTEEVDDKIEEQLNIQTTVKQELKWIGEILAKAMDLGHQVDVGNTQAKADVQLEDGQVLLYNVPGTSLLRLEKRVVEIRDLVHAIPTLAPAKGFQLDPTEGDGIYRARDDERPRTEKQFSFKVMVQATDKHPAQVKELMMDVVVGTTVTQEWSGLITTADKGNMLNRVEEVLRAVKKARSRANEIELNISNTKIGDRVIEYVFNGVTDDLQP